jgi:hypothetical protein
MTDITEADTKLFVTIPRGLNYVIEPKISRVQSLLGRIFGRRS